MLSAGHQWAGGGGRDAQCAPMGEVIFFAGRLNGWDRKKSTYGGRWAPVGTVGGPIISTLMYWQTNINGVIILPYADW
jgi:hypothetical protein